MASSVPLISRGAFALAVVPPMATRAFGGMSSSLASSWDAAEYQRNAHFVPELGKTVIDLLGPRKGEKVLDVGCGDGVLTAELETMGCIVVGIDFSSDMVASARTKGVNAHVVDAAAMDDSFLLRELNRAINPPTGQDPAKEANPEDVNTTDTQRYDAVFSNAALHWVQPLSAAIKGAKSVLRPGGRFVGEFGGHGNVAAVRSTLHALLRARGVDPILVDPWFFPSCQEYKGLLEEEGFIVDEVTLSPRPTVLPRDTGMQGWLQVFAKAFLDAAAAAEAGVPPGAEKSPLRSPDAGVCSREESLLEEALGILRPALMDADGLWTADYVRIRFCAHLPHG
ncbi:unnamed protein product [Discosporangium mesarthrocarpum]